MWRGSTSRYSIGLLILVAAAGLSCSGGIGGDSVTGPDLVAAAPGVEDSGTFEASKRTDKVVVCHKGKDLRVAPSAVAAHLRHGDTEGSCSSPCPCFTADQVAAAASCDGAATQCIRFGDSYLCRIVCDSASFDFFLASDTCEGPRSSSPVDSTQHDACFDILLTECPAFDF